MTRRFPENTGATSATGPHPQLGHVASARVGSLTFSNTSGKGVLPKPRALNSAPGQSTLGASQMKQYFAIAATWLAAAAHLAGATVYFNDFETAVGPGWTIIGGGGRLAWIPKRSQAAFWDLTTHCVSAVSTTIQFS